VNKRNDHLLLANEAALALVTVSAIVGMHRLFIDGSYRGPLVAAAIVAHVSVAALRRARVHLVPAALATAALAVIFISWTRFPDTTHWLLPTGETLTKAGDDLEAAWRLFGKVRAPAPVENGFLAVSAAAIWLIVFVADWAAFRVNATFEALLPATTLFVFSAALGGSSSPVAGAALFAGSALLFVLLQRTSNQERTSRWASEHRTQGRWSLLGTGGLLIALAVIGGTIAGPQLPGADEDALLAWRDLTRDTPTRVVRSPMVQLQTRQVDQTNVELFTISSPVRSYWRLTALETFDGDIWKSGYSTEDADGELPQALDPASSTQTVPQSFTITGLRSVWLPAAFEPRAIDTGDDDQPADFDERSSTLLVDKRVDTSDGYTYDVESAVPTWTAEQLRGARPEIPQEIAEVFLDLPGTFPERVTDEAEQVTAEGATAYDKARLLQDFFRDPNRFTYDLNVGAGHSNRALETFLFGGGRGYCEQFAGAFAAMARAVGIPARVAVGFTPGIQDPNDPNLYRVRGIHAHAWPEVYLGEYGWVPFEPTPTRGPPGATGFLGVPERQETATGVAGAEGFVDPNEDLSPGENPEDLITEGLPNVDLGGGGEGADAAGDDGGVLPDPVWTALKVVAVVVLAYLVVVPLVLLVQRSARRRRASAPADRVRLAWRVATEHASDAGVSLPTYLTLSETAERLATAMPTTADAARGMAHTMERIAYAEQPPTAEEVTGAEEGSAAVSAEAARRQTWPQRMLSHLDIRRVRPVRPSRLVASYGPR
jgi:transglutaminase-like putative cysteine protease